MQWQHCQMLPEIAYLASSTECSAGAVTLHCLSLAPRKHPEAFPFHAHSIILITCW